MANSLSATVTSTLPELQEGPQTEPEAEAAHDVITDQADGEQAGRNDTAINMTSADPDFGIEVLSETQSKQHKLGLDINEPWGWNGSLYNDYDVVTVHGIRDDYSTAWTDAEGSWWVREQLFKDLSIREVDYSYEIDTAAAIYATNGIVQHAQELAENYAEVRQELEETETDRPIIWICHDLGGTIVKEALRIAIHDPAKYGKIAVLTTGIIFLGTPHQAESIQDLEDQLYQLLLLPGPQINHGRLAKSRELARQVTKINQRFLGTKILDRAGVFNLFTQNESQSRKRCRIDGKDVGGLIPTLLDSNKEDDTSGPVTPFPRYSHHVGHAFEAPGRSRLNELDHSALIRGGALDDMWLPWVSSLFNLDGFHIRVNYHILRFQAWVLALTPPTRALGTPWDPVLPKAPVMEWIYKQEPYISFSRPGGGVRVLNLYTNGNSLIDISEVSRLFYFDFDSDNTHPYETVLNSPRMTAYFEFDQHDSRYNTISSLLIYLLNIFVWRFWPGSEELISTELRFLSHTNAWSHEDLFHLYSTLRNGGRGSKLLTIFISCFDQCPKDQRDWFLERIVKEQSYSDATYRLIVSSSAKDDLAEGSFPNETCINLDDSPTLRGIGDNMAKEIESSLSSLMVKRPVYEGLRPHIENVLEPLCNLPFLSRIILTWLETHLRGKPRDRIADVVRKLTPATTENVVKVFIASLDPMLRSRAETVFNWIKYAAEPWSPEALTEALAVHDSGSKEPSLHDLDVERTVAEIEEAFGGIIIVKDRSVKFSHASFYLVPALGFEGSDVEKTERANSTIANTCLRYFHLSGAQENFSKLFRNNSNADGAPWVTELDTAIISHDRTSMAEYAVRFWHHHYQVSGQFKPKDLVYKLFASTDARASWAVPFWLLSNPFTRIQRSYVSTLPTFAMLGLEDLVQEAIQHERNQPKFEKDCWFAIVEAARAGRKAMVQSLLKEVTVDEDELQIALHWAVACQDAGIVDILLDKIPNPETFHWPDNILHQASAAGLNDVIAFLLSAGFDVDEPCGLYWGAPPAVIIAWRNRVSTMEFLLSSGYEPNLAIKDTGGDDPLMTAADKGIPRMVDMLVQNGASVETTNDNGNRPVLRAARECNYKAVDLLIQAEADLVSGSEDGLKSPLITAAASGSLECVRVLLANGADPDVEIDGMTALYEAVASNYPDIVALLLAHDPRPNMEKTPPGQLRLLMRAVGTKNAELVSLLLEHGTTVDFFDPNAATLTKTPLSEACSQGNLEIVKLLLAKGADINYAEGNSDSPLLAATMGSSEVARYLLLNPTIDVRWAASDGTTALHTADYDPSLVAELLQRGAHIDAHSTSFGTAIHKATRSNSANIIEVLLANDPKPDVDFLYGEDGWQYEEIGFTALQLACKYGFPECAKALLKGGANPRFINKNGDDAVDVVLQAQSESKDALECLQLLLSVPYSVPADQVSEHGRTRLHGIQEKTPVTVVQNLLEVNAPLDVENREGHSPLSIAVSKGNEDVVRYLVKQGATVNRCKPSFGSILHLAVKRGDLQIAKFLIESGAELDTVDPEYGESLLYTALGIEDYAKLKAMVRYLVDDVKAPINKLGGVHFSYPIIRAANLARANHAWVPVLGFLISRNAQLDVADSQGRRAVHVASASWWDDAIKLLVKAGANMDVVDAIGRKPIHFAASSMWSDCFEYLVNTYPDMDMNEADYDKWTPLMWAARSGTADTMIRLLQGNVDVWARSCDSNMKIEWSALKLLNFSGHNDPEESLQLDFKERTQPRPEQEMEEWDDPFHKIETGHLKNYRCNSCFLTIRGIAWKCISCDNDFTLCFKCFGRHSTVHDVDHEFEGIEPLYERHTPSPGLGEDGHDSKDDNLDDAAQENSRILEIEEAVDEDDDVAWLHDRNSPEFDIDVSVVDP